jgi:hypothetical protein
MPKVTYLPTRLPYLAAWKQLEKLVPPKLLDDLPRYEEQGGEWMKTQDILNRFPDLRISSDGQISRKQKPPGYQVRRAVASLKCLYPNGVPERDVIGTSPLQRKVAEDLKGDSKEKGLEAPSWQVVDKARDLV